MDDKVSTADKDLLRRFLAGKLETEQARVLDARLDAEPALNLALERLARGSATVAFQSSDFGTTRLTTVALKSSLAPQPIEAGVDIGEVLARGGMGTVYQGKQRSLGRAVAIKTTTADLTAPLLQEARVTGFLEHPNIVPVHDITKDDKGRPVVVLKRIEGTSWRKLIDRDHPKAQASTEMIERHVSIAIQVCQALRYAHSRKIVHRDIKPSNVMVGKFDEVYLLDWGIALSLDESEKDRFLTRKHTQGVSGTPSYMAPEQFADNALAIGPHTDVYLTAASLFHAITGRPPQAGRELGVIHRMLERRKSLRLPDWVPFELAEILNRAMSVDLDDRTPSMAMLRAELVGFLSHQGSAQLVTRGDRAAERMRNHHNEGDDDAAERAFFDATSSYRAATEAWQENPIAPRRLRETVTDRVEELLRLDSPRAALRALSLLNSPPNTLQERVSSALASERSNRKRLEVFDHGEDRVFGLKDRRNLTIILGAVWLSWWTFMAVLPVKTALPVFVGSVIATGLTLASFARYRDVMLDVRLNRYNVGIGLATIIMQTFLAAVAWARGILYADLLEQLLALWALGTACAAVVVDRRMAASAGLNCALLAFCAWQPTFRRWASVMAMTAMLVISLGINLLTARAARIQARSEFGESP